MFIITMYPFLGSCFIGASLELGSPALTCSQWERPPRSKTLPAPHTPRLLMFVYTSTDWRYSYRLLTLCSTERNLLYFQVSKYFKSILWYVTFIGWQFLMAEKRRGDKGRRHATDASSCKQSKKQMHVAFLSARTVSFQGVMHGAQQSVFNTTDDGGVMECLQCWTACEEFVDL